MFSLKELSEGWVELNESLGVERSNLRELRRTKYDSMKRKLLGLSKRYVAALRQHLKRGARAIPPWAAALRLGRRAVALGLETLELARLHERALATLKLSKGKGGALKRAQIFFTAANIPIEETHGTARQSKMDMHRLNETLSRRTRELAATNRQVQRGVVRRKVMADTFAKSGRRHDKSLEESLELQRRLRQLTHRALVTQEDERKKISHELRDEIAQTLLGINVRLLSLKRGDRSNTKGLKNEIASAQRLVVKSARSVRQFAHELNIHHEAHYHPFVPAL